MYGPIAYHGWSSGTAALCATSTALQPTDVREAVRLARERKSHQIFLTTHLYQAPDLYTRLGFETVATIDDDPIARKFYTMRKLL